ncbi:hypothetical protein D920_00277 [Enterococcus faecalis 13-SD-W-01]|nr:hypothetical protein D920_00277 [Enterococcus faecalis 13-SD-W-01]
MKTKNILFLFHTYKFLKMILGNISLLTFLKLTLPTLYYLQNILIMGMVISFLFYIKRILAEIYFFQYTFFSDHVEILSGIWYKKNYSIDYTNISGANWSQPYFYRLFNVFKLVLFLPDTGDNKKQEIPIISRYEKEIIDKQLYLSLHETNYLQENLESFIVYKPVPIKTIVYSSFITLNYLYLLTIFFFLSDVFNYFNINLFNIVNKFFYSNIYLGVISIFLLSCVSAILKQFLSFYKFSVRDYRHYLEVTNGIVKNSAVKIKKDSITGLVVSSSLGQSILRLASVKAIVLNSETEDKQIKLDYFLPYQRQRDLKDKIQNIFPDNHLLDYNFSYNFFKPRLFIIVSFILLTFGIFSIGSPFYVYLLVFIFEFILFRILNIVLTKIRIDQNKICISTGIITRKHYFLDISSLEWKKNIQLGNNINLNRIGIKIHRLSKFRFINNKNSMARL